MRSDLPDPACSSSTPGHGAALGASWGLQDSRVAPPAPPVPAPWPWLCLPCQQPALPLPGTLNRGPTARLLASPSAVQDPWAPLPPRPSAPGKRSQPLSGAPGPGRVLLGPPEAEPRPCTQETWGLGRRRVNGSGLRLSVQFLYFLLMTLLPSYNHRHMLLSSVSFQDMSTLAGNYA